MSQPRPTFRPRLESLERRNLMAGNVMVSVNAEGDLYVTGDDASNNIVIENIGSTLRVSQNPNLIGQFGATKINSQTNGVFSVAMSRLKDDFHIKMNGGNDVVAISGNSRYLLEGVVVKDDLFIDMGSGNDLLDIHCAIVYSDVNIQTGTGSNYTYLGDFYVNDDMLIANSSAALSSNHDEVYLVGQVDVVDDLTIDLFMGNDIVDINEAAIGDLHIELYGGNDTVSITDSIVERTWDIDGGTGYDTITRYGNNRALPTTNFERFLT